MAKARRALEAKKARTAEAYAKARAGAHDVFDRKSLSPVQSFYDAETGHATNMLRRHFKGKMKEKFTAQYARPLRARLETHFAGVGKRMGAEMAEGAVPLLEEGVETTTALLGELGGLEAPSGLYEQVEALHASKLEQLRASSGESLAEEIGDETWQGLRAAFEEETSVGDLVNLAGELMDGQAWKVERLVRTEASYGYNLAQAAALRAFPTEKGQLLWGRWTERVDDESGEPLDDRVGKDSIVLHGQVARPGGLYTMPVDALAPESMIGMQWAFPPNRPNDRAILLPWMRDWGVSGWVYQGGRRIYLNDVDPGRVFDDDAGSDEEADDDT